MMGRVPKYRAWYKPKGVMIEPENLVMINFDTKVLGVYMEMDGKGYHVLRMSDFELLESTGLKDKKGQEIYEGYIVHFLDAYMHGEDGDWDECSCVGQIKWDDGMAQYYVTNRNSMDNDDFWEQIEEFEVIGNIYENPELIEV